MESVTERLRQTVKLRLLGSAARQADGVWGQQGLPSRDSPLGWQELGVRWCRKEAGGAGMQSWRDSSTGRQWGGTDKPRCIRGVHSSGQAELLKAHAEEWHGHSCVKKLTWSLRAE